MIYREINIAILLLSIIICLSLLAYQVAIKNKEKSDKWFVVMIVGNLFMLFGDLADCGLHGIPGKLVYITEYIFAVFGYYIASGFMLLGLFGWIASYIEKKKPIPIIFKRICVGITLVQCVNTLLMPITRICYVDPVTNSYTRGQGFMWSYIIPYVMYLITFGILIRNMRMFEKREWCSLFSFFVLPLCANVMQILYGDLLVFNAVLTVGILAVVLFVQTFRQQEQESKIAALVQAENAKLYDMSTRQDHLILQLIDTLCGTVEAKDIYTRGHSLRVAQYAREIMYRLGGDEQEQHQIYCIGILHDVGKIRVKDEIINKNGKLTDEEYEQMKLHTIAGYQILREVDLIPGLAVGARWHHERYDGGGYPNGLAGENIPLIARIISVADAYDAMTSNRSYRSIMPQVDVREQIVKGMGTQFDPKIAQIMIDMIDEDLQYDMKQINFNSIVNILMIDDDAVSQQVVENMLELENYVVTFASSGEEAIEILKSGKFDLCLLDMELPGMNGFDVLKWIHKHVRRMKVIFLTGDKDLKTIQLSEQHGAVDYITKPINARILRESIKNVLLH